MSEVAGLSISNLTVKFGGLVALDDVFIALTAHIAEEKLEAAANGKVKRGKR